MKFFGFWRKRRDAELSEEIAAHLQMEEADRRERGESPDAAREQTRRQFGNVESVKEVTREMWGWGALERIGRDLRFGARMLARSPGFTAVAILTLALGIGANTAIYSLMDSLLMKTLAVQAPEELEVIGRLSPKRLGNEPQRIVTNTIWEQVRDQQNAFSGVFAWGDAQFNLADGGEARFVRGLWVSGDYFATLGTVPAAGRLIWKADDFHGCQGVAALSYNYWQRQFGGDPGVVGRTISVEGHPFEIVGVAPKGFYGLDVGDRFEVALPICAEPVLSRSNDSIEHRSYWWLSIGGRRLPGLSESEAQTRMRTVAPTIFAAAVPYKWGLEDQNRFKATTIGLMSASKGLSYLRRKYTEPLRVLLGISGLVLVIACANISSLLLARGAAREREVAVRRALGATRWRLVRQMFTECLLLSVMGTALGLLVAQWGSAMIVRYISTQRSPVFLDLSLNWHVLGFAAGIAFVTACLFGIWPVLRTTGSPLFTTMKGSAAGNKGQGKFRGGRSIVVVQMALSLLLLVTSGLLLRSFTRMLSQDNGFDRKNVVLASLDIHTAKRTVDQAKLYYGGVLEKAKEIPGVDSASVALLTPLSQMTWNNNVTTGEPDCPKGDDSLVYFNYVSPGYLQTVRGPLVDGRDFTPADTATSAKVAIVSESFARRFFPGRNAIGRTFRVDDIASKPKDPIEIVGIMKDVKYESLREDFLATALIPLSQLDEGRLESATLLARTGSEPGQVIAGIRGVVHDSDPRTSLQFTTLEKQVDDSITQERTTAILCSFFSGLALLLALLGLYGVMAYLVTLRRKEIGIRMALGALPGVVQRMVLREVLAILGAGILLGGLLSFWGTRVVEKMLYGVHARDLNTAVVAAVLLSLVGVLAGYLPARRAARLEPMKVLREE